MRKILVSMFLLVFGLCLVGCMNNDGFIKPSVLRKSGLSDLITPPHTDVYKRESLGYCYFNSTKEEFENYAAELYNYLIEKNYKYFGYAGDVFNSLFGANGTYELILSTTLSDHYEEHFYYEKLNTIDYTFIFAEKLNSDNELSNDVMVRLSLKIDGTFDNGYNTSLEVRNNSNLMTSFVYIPQCIEFLQIEEAYNNGLINKEDLQEIADILNGITQTENIYNRAYEIAIKRKHLESLIKIVPDAELDDISVSYNFENENGYVARVRNRHTDYPDVEKEILIDDILITYSGPKPMFVKKVNE